jgi:hypothetical protein
MVTGLDEEGRAITELPPESPARRAVEGILSRYLEALKGPGV